LLQRLLVEIQQQPQLQAANPKIGEQLCLVHRQKLLNRLDFNDEDLLDEYVNFQVIVDLTPLIDYR
jgi:hypothetical protein